MEIASVLMKSAGLLIQILGSPIAKEINSIWKYEADIKRFADTVGYIGDVLSDMEGRHFQEASVKTAYKRLREAFLDAEDFLDAVETHRKKQEAIATKLNKEKEEMMNKAGGKKKRLFAHVRIKKKAILVKARRIFTIPNKAKHAVKVHNAIDEMRKNLDDIANDLHKFQPIFTLEATDRMTNIRAMGTCVDADKMIGREDDKRNIIDLLLRSSNDPLNIPVISIVGMGGMGKTTTAQLLYNDQSWQNSCGFDLKLWVTDSKTFDVKSVLKKIVRSTTDDENGLREQLAEKIGGKRFLLVLDDVENEDHLIWEQLQDLLNHGNKESRILVTTRSKGVARIMGSVSAYKLRGLSEIDALQLFERYAFRGRRDENLVEIGKLVAKKCLGVPLAIKVIGSLLCGKDQLVWERVRDTNLVIKDVRNQIIPILKMSYDNLDSTLKQCFSYCSLFPKNYIISGQILSSVWRANVRFKNESETLEDDCEKNLKALYDRSLLEATEWIGDVGDRCFIMHDLIHDLANEVAGEEMFVANSNAKMDSNRLIVEENVRHFSLMWNVIKADGTPPFEIKGRRLRTFIQPDPPSLKESRAFINDELVIDCPVLRLLNVHSWGIKKLQNSFGKLIHLRHLDLSFNKFQTLPNSIVELINLRYLNLSYCRALTHLPSGMDALTSLEVLHISSCDSLEELPLGFENLNNLRHLDLSRSKAASSSMPSKMGVLTSLEVLNMSGCVESEEQLMGIEKLIKLKLLNLAGCSTLTHLPAEIGALTSLEVIDISSWGELEELPTGIEKLIKLRHLKLSGCKALTHMPCEIGALVSLEVLHISWCNKLVELPVSIEKLIKLRHLKLTDCKALTHLPSGMGSLTSLELLDISGCDKLKELPVGIGKLINLKTLDLKGCEALTRMPSGMGALTSLVVLHKFIVGDPESKHDAQLEELGPLSELTNRTLTIELPNNMTMKGTWDGEAFLLNKKRLWSLEIKWQDNPKEELPMNHMEILAKLQPPPNLIDFRLHGYQGKTFPYWFPNEGFASILPNLEKICISNCRKCQLLPPLSGLPRLKSLTLRGLSNLEYIEENISAATFCRSLKWLVLDDLPKLKGWCKGLATGVDAGDILPNLKEICISNCRKCQLLPPLSGLPHLERLTLRGLSNLEYIEENISAASFCRSLRRLELDDLPELKGWCKGLNTGVGDDCEHEHSLILPSFPRLKHLGIGSCPNLTLAPILVSSSTPPPLSSSSSSVGLLVQVCSDGGGFTYFDHSLDLIISGWNASDNPSIRMDESFREMSKHLRKLEFNNCSGLKTLPAGVEHLTRLSRLEIKQCREFTAGEDGEMPWKELQSLRYLTFSELPKMVALPEGIQFITFLQVLQIEHCDNLLLPEWLHTTFKHEKHSAGDRFIKRQHARVHGPTRPCSALSSWLGSFAAWFGHC